MLAEQAMRVRALVGTALTLACAGALAQNTTMDEINRYRQMLQDGNPAELLVVRGEDLWKTARGPKNASLEQCDLGLGPGVVKGAYVRLPRYFADAEQVLDFEGRLVYCMVTLQGMKREDAVKSPFSGAGQRQTDIEALTTYVVEQSRGSKIDVPQEHPKEKAAFERGKYLFYMRGGPYDFACSTCHGVDNQRIRLQDLPNFEKSEPAQRAFAQWPAYRVSQGALRTMQHRMWDCFRQQRWPVPEYGSDVITALTVFLNKQANGGELAVPSIKR